MSVLSSAAWIAPLLLAGVTGAAAQSKTTWRPLPSVPDREGFAGSYAGVSHGTLLVAGGSNFPEKRPWEGGRKFWYDHVFALASENAQWREVGHLPAAAGYGVTLTLEEGVLLIGGSSAEKNLSTVTLMSWDGQSLEFNAWPALPKPLGMCTGARVGRLVYVAGGLDRPDAGVAQRDAYVLDLDHLDAGWHALPPLPGPERFLAVSGAFDGGFYLFGGARLVPGPNGQPIREWLRDAWRYTPEKGWQRLADLPRSSVAAPSPAPTVGDCLLVLGGDDGSQVDVAPTAHRGFPRDVLAYDPARDRWEVKGELPFSLVTTTATSWHDGIVIAGGEARPGIRSPAVWTSAPAN